MGGAKEFQKKAGNKPIKSRRTVASAEKKAKRTQKKRGKEEKREGGCPKWGARVKPRGRGEGKWSVKTMK